MDETLENIQKSIQRMGEIVARMGVTTERFGCIIDQFFATMDRCNRIKVEPPSKKTVEWEERWHK